MIKIILFLSIGFFGLAINVFSQPKEITKEQYYKSFREAIKKASETSRRSIDRRDYFRDGKLHSSEETIDEFLAPDKIRYLVAEKVADRNTKNELIKIGETYYCRKDNGEWRQSSNYCGGSGLSGISNIISSKYTVEEVRINNQIVKLHHQYTTYKNTYSPDKHREGLSYWKSNFWLNNEGFIQREEGKSGLLEPNRIYNQRVKSYEYNPKDLKIEAPIIKSAPKVTAHL